MLSWLYLLYNICVVYAVLALLYNIFVVYAVLALLYNICVVYAVLAPSIVKFLCSHAVLDHSHG